MHLGLVCQWKLQSVYSMGCGSLLRKSKTMASQLASQRNSLWDFESQ